jgi:hypothetical protein
MNLELRLAALSRLMEVESDEADKRLVQEFDKARRALRQSEHFDELSDALKTLAVLAPKFHGAIISLLTEFVRSVENRKLGHGDALLAGALSRYQTPSVLIREAVDVADRVRYLNTEEVLDFLLELSRSTDEAVRNKAQQSMEELAEFNIDIFFGEHGLGAEPQARIVGHFAKLPPAQLASDSAAVLRTLTAVLSPTMQGTSWTYNSITIRRGAVSAGHSVADMRLAAIELLKRMYPLSEAVSYRRSVLRTLGAATRREQPSDDAETRKMFARDAIEVLTFVRGLVANESLPLLQVIEHDAYWDFFHAATPEVEAAALQVRDALAGHSEYQIYKLLIGFEGIFGKWEDLKRSETAWDYGDSHRHAAAETLVSQINDANSDEWRNRILEFSQTQSDDLATFPVYYSFLQAVGRRHPELALELVTKHEQVMSPFLIPLVRGVWSSPLSNQIEEAIWRWIAVGKHLSAIAKSLYQTGSERLHTLKAVIDRASSIDNRYAIITAMGVAATLYGEGNKAAKEVFMIALRLLARLEDANWARHIWHSREIRVLIQDLDTGERAELLAALTSLDKIDYQSEEILFAIAKHDAPAVLEYLAGRLAEERGRRQRDPDESAYDEERYEAVPYQLTKLNEALSAVPEAVVKSLRKDFAAEAPGMFTYRGARLIHGVFPEFGPPLEAVLHRLVEGGEPKDIDFVLAVLRTYEGSPAILEVCRAIVRVVPERSEAWRTLAAAIESTGVVWGEYGIVQAYKSKRASLEHWKDDESARVRAFAEWIIQELDHMIEAEKRRADEQLALRKHRYGVGGGTSSS